MFTEQLDSANKQRAAKEAEGTDPKHHVFVKLLEQSKFSLPGLSNLVETGSDIEAYAPENRDRLL